MSSGKWKRIRPGCDVTDCVNCENGLCGILDDTNFTGECRFYRPRKQAPVIVVPVEKKKEAPKDFVSGQKDRINNLWRKKDEQVDPAGSRESE